MCSSDLTCRYGVLSRFPSLTPTISMSEFLDVFCNLIIRIRSNLYPGLLGSDPLLGVDKELKTVKILVDITCND